jgi:hypothetical protein
LSSGISQATDNTIQLVCKELRFLSEVSSNAINGIDDAGNNLILKNVAAIHALNPPIDNLFGGVLTGFHHRPPAGGLYHIILPSLSGAPQPVHITLRRMCSAICGILSCYVMRHGI